MEKKVKIVETKSSVIDDYPLTGKMYVNSSWETVCFTCEGKYFTHRFDDWDILYDISSPLGRLLYE